MAETDRTEFKDHFSKKAAAYAAFRPRYPAALFAFLASHAPRRVLAWDCATGNGQAAVGLAEHFERVIATDASAAQIGAATPHERIEYRVARAEASGLADASVDLVTVAQALHWLDLDAFYAEVRRVLVPDGVIAVWCYSMASIAPEIDSIVNEYYAVTCGPYWPFERRHVDAGYRTLPFPFDETDATAAPLAIELWWTLADLEGYLRTWSATQRLVADRGGDPVGEVIGRLAPIWGDASTRRLVRWPVWLRLGRC